MSDGSNVVILNFRAPKLQVVDDEALVTCRHCRNDTYILVNKPGDFPVLRCDGCATVIGRVGFPPPAADRTG